MRFTSRRYVTVVETDNMRYSCFVKCSARLCKLRFVFSDDESAPTYEGGIVLKRKYHYYPSIDPG
jgi:hypothetical protein